MQFSESWLRTMVDPDMTSDELAHLLTMSGLEVEEVEPVAPPFSGVFVAEVLEVAKHPNADRLSVCQVDVGTGTLLNVVCGAPNVRAGMRVPCAVTGAKLPPAEEGGAPFEIKTGKLRGVESQGMLCSARELKLAEDHSGLMELPGDAPVGRNFRDYLQLNDLKLTIKLTPNRADCLSVLGVAREVAALTGASLRMPAIQPVQPTSDEVLPVAIEAADLCGRFAGRVIRGLNARAQTPQWMRQRLERSGQRSISALVDISNYVMLELGRPTHVFDLDKIHGGLTVRWGRPGESLTLLNGMTVPVDEQVGVVADDRQVESLAGVMGGEPTAVSLDTTDIYLEAAFWWPDAIRGRARRYNFSTDAAHRFERGVDYASVAEHMERITALILEICGTPDAAVGPIDDQVTALPQRRPVTLRTARASKIIGIPFDDQQIASIFERLGLPFTRDEGQFTVTPPSYRFDIEIEEDLVEEVVRVHGFENIPALPPVAPQAMRIPPEAQRSLFDIRHRLAACDYQEVVNFSFVDASWEKDFCNNDAPIRLQNPIASQLSVMRSSLIASLTANVRYNVNRKASRIRLFEVGAVYLRDAAAADGPLSVAGYRQPKRVAAIAYGPALEEQWGQKARNADFFDIKADLEALFAPLPLTFVKSSHPALHPGRSAEVLLDGRAIGILGELHPRLQQQYDLPLAPVVFEVDAQALQARPLPRYQEISRFPLVTRDIAFVVTKELPVQALMDAMLEQMRENPVCGIVQAIVLFDEYQGKGLSETEKSLAFRLTLQDTQSTLQEEAVDAAVEALVAAAAARHSARLRS